MASHILRFCRLTDKAIAPIRSSTKAAGYDLSSAYDYEIPAGGKCLCATDIQIAVPDDCYGRVAPRSGLASKFMIDTGAGVIDADYRGNVMVLLFNHGKEKFDVKAGDRIAQLILERIRTPPLEEVASLDATERGEAGFGSTGVGLRELSSNVVGKKPVIIRSITVMEEEINVSPTKTEKVSGSPSPTKTEKISGSGSPSKKKAETSVQGLHEEEPKRTCL